nr:MAG TPA: Helix-turn-helix XRE-family like protein [Caudoviricetes sp.]
MLQLRRLRLDRGVRIKDLAAMTGLTERAIDYYESHQRRPGMQAILSICSALECSPNELLGWKGGNKHERKREKAG